MKKLIIFVALVMGFVFANAQVQHDTVMYIDEITIYPNASVNDSTGDYYEVIGIYESSLEARPLYSGATKIVFNTNGLDTNDFIVLYLNEWTVSHQVIGYDTVYVCDTMFTDIIESIDTVLEGHPGLYHYDTTYVIDYIDTTDIFEKAKLGPIFHNGYNECMLSSLVGDSIYIDSISIFVMNETLGDSVGTNAVYINDLYVIVECDNLNANDADMRVDIRMYPNPTSGIIYLDGIYETLTIHDMNGRLLVKITDSKVTSFDMSRLKNGEYFFTLDGYHTIKVIKK